MADTEEYFPRGGKKPTTQYFKPSSNFLGAAEKKERKKTRPKKKSEGDDGYLSDETSRGAEKSYKNCAAGLSYTTVKEGVLILGRVRSVLETKVNVMLPCKMMGAVMACHVSEPYNKLLEAYVNDQIDKVRELGEMFKPGQYVAVRVLEAEGSRLMLSMMPQHINKGKMQADLHIGTLLQAAVSSVEDHGYVMDLGIPGTRAFLPKNKSNTEVELDVGALTWCVVKSTSDSVVTVSSHLMSLQQAVLKRKPNVLLPGTAVDLTVDEALENGIKGRVFGEMEAYVQRQHADTVGGKKPALGQRVRARILYVMPTRNTPFLTMRDIFAATHPDLEQEQKLKEGDIVEQAKVIKITGRSIHFKLCKGCVGTMSLKRIQVHEDLSDEEVVAKSYPVGSDHKVRVLCYNLSDYTYSVSDEPSILNERYFSMERLVPGEAVPCTVRAHLDNTVCLNVGRFTGYVPHAHLTDAGVFVDPKKPTTSKLPKKKFKVGQEVRARVLSVDPAKQAVFLTLKPSLLAPDLEVLASYEQAEVGKAYTGVIKYIRDYLIVSFFNNVVALVPRHYVTKEQVDNLFDAFHVGQIVNCTILKVDAEAKKMQGSLTTAPFWPAKKREKRKKPFENDKTEVPNKKQKSDDESDTSKKKKDKKSKKDEETEPEKIEKKKKDKKSKQNEEIETIEIEKKKDKKSKQDKEIKTSKKGKQSKEIEETKSEESDAIETDIQSDDLLTPQDLALIDLTDCVTPKQYKKRVVSLLKAIKARTRRLDTIQKKIVAREELGLDARNKQYHTAMQMDKLVVQERIQKLMEALVITQEKLKTLNPEENIDFKNKKDKKKNKKGAEIDNEQKTEVKSISAEVNSKSTEVKSKVKSKNKEVAVVENLEPALDIPSAKDFWSANVESLAKNVQEEDDSSSDDEEKDQPKKKRKKLTASEKVAKAREEEERVREMERRAIASESQPQSSEQFERALLASPDCSQLWIAYMAFHLQATEIDKARAVCRKALSTISFREEQERLNVWLALLNCEHRFGTKESQQKTLEEALQMNDTFKIHSKLLDILSETGKHQELSALVDLMIKKYKRDPQTYVLCGGSCFRLGLVDKARQVMQKAVAVLEKKEHVSILVQFALLERSHGARERAEALFEQVLTVYPQRVDVCSAYVDMLAKSGDKDHVRQVMERMTSQKLPARKMKTLYRKWIEVEEKLGDQEQVETIRQRAMEYIDKAKF